MHKNWWLTLLCSLLLVFGIPLLFLDSIWNDGEKRPLAEDGVLDLRDWNFSNLIELNGEWEFYRGKLLAPEDFAASADGASPMPDAIVQVPGKWNSYNGENGHNTALGVGTYRLKVRLSGEQTILGLQTGIIRSANRIYWNNLELGSSGIPALEKKDGKSENTPYTAFAAVSDGEEYANILVQVSNYSYSSGGMISSIRLGSDAVVLKQSRRNLMADTLSSFVFAIIAVYCLAVYRIYRRDLGSLYLGCFCVAGLFYILTHGERLIYVPFPGLPYEYLLKIQMISSTLVYFFLLLYIDAFFPRAVKPLFKRIGSAFAWLLIMLAIVLDGAQFSKLEPIILLFGASSLGYVLYLHLMGSRRWSNRSLLMVTGGLSLLAVIAVNFLKITGFLTNDWVMIYEIILFILTQISILSLRHADSVREVENLSTRLLSLDGMKDEFMVSTSRELRTPLYAIINIADSLLNGTAGRLSDKQAEHISLVASSGRRLSLIIDGVLDFTAIRSGSITLHPRPLSLPDAVRSVWQMVSLAQAGDKVEFIEKWPDPMPRIVMDEARLYQILSTLLGNALRFTPHGSITVSARSTGQRVTLTIEDTGIGIEQKLLDNLFSAFDANNILHGKLSTVTGFSLSVAKELIQLSDGQIWADSKLGEGSRFHISLPAAAQDSEKPVPAYAAVENGLLEAAAATEPLWESFASQDSTRKTEVPFTVLIVGSDPITQKVLQSLLAVDRYKVITADSGKEALELLMDVPSVDLAIIDWVTPGMSGLELCSRIRARYLLSELPVLMLTARSGPEDILAGFRVGVNDFVSKPVNAGELRARARTLVELHRSVQTYVRTEMAFLQAQIKPHFLYNVLNTIIALCPIDPDKTLDLLYNLSRYLRGSFEFHNQDQFIPLYKELELVESYVDLEKARFDERLRYQVHIDCSGQALIPPLSIQPIVENAIRHGIMQRPEGGIVNLRVTREDGRMLVSVSDNGVGMSRDQAEGLLNGAREDAGVGLLNIHRRLLSITGTGGLKIESIQHHGTTISFELPYRTHTQTSIK